MAFVSAGSSCTAAGFPARQTTPESRPSRTGRDKSSLRSSAPAIPVAPAPHRRARILDAFIRPLAALSHRACAQSAPRPPHPGDCAGASRAGRQIMIVHWLS